MRYQFGSLGLTSFACRRIFSACSFFPKRGKRRRVRRGDGVVGSQVQGSEVLGFSLGGPTLTLAKTSHLQPGRHKSRIQRNSFPQALFCRDRLLILFLKQPHSQVSYGFPGSIWTARCASRSAAGISPNSASLLAMRIWAVTWAGSP